MALLLTANGFPQQAIQCSSIKYADQAASTPRIDTMAFFRSVQLASTSPPATQITPDLIDPTLDTDFSSLSVSNGLLAESPAVALASIPAGDGTVADGYLEPMDDAGGTTRAGGWKVLTPFYGQVTYTWTVLAESINTTPTFAGYAVVDNNIGNANSPMPIVGTLGLRPSGSVTPFDVETIHGSYNQKFAVDDFIQLRAASLGETKSCSTLGWSIRVEVLTDLSA